MNLVINTSADPTNSLVVGLADNNTATLDPIFFGDVINVTAIFSNGLGDYADFSGRTNNVIKIGLGNPKTRSEFSSAIMSFSVNKYESQLNIDTTDLDNYLTADTADLFLEIQISYSNQNCVTLCQVPITIREQIIA